MFPPDFGIERICYKVFPMSTTTQGPSGEDIQLLVVDDDPGIRDLLCRYLGEQGLASLWMPGWQKTLRIWLFST